MFITYVTQKSIKERAIAEHLVEHPIKDEYEFKDWFHASIPCFYSKNFA